MAPSEQDFHRTFLRLFASNEPAIRAFIRRLVPSRADADDIMQDVSIVLWEKFDAFEEGGNFRAWAFGVARYEVLAWFRDKGRDRLVLNEKVVDLLADESLETVPRFDRQREALEVCMEKVAPEQRDLLMKAYQPGAQIRELASDSGRTESGFYQWLYRLRRSLLDCIRRNMAKGGAA